MKYQEAIEYMDNIPKYGVDTGLERTGYILEEMGHPERNMKIIHVAGTNGKGSTCAYIAKILSKCGRSTGLFISPHLVKINERIRVNEEIIDDTLFEEAFNVIHDIGQKLFEERKCQIRYFDYIFAMAIYIFAKEKVEYAVIETGIGGRLDSTNAVENPIVSVIASISYDHTEVLGDTLEEIAHEKAGIIKKEVPVVYLGLYDESNHIIEEKARMNNAKSIPVVEKQWKIIKNSGKRIDFSLNNSYYKNGMFSIKSSATYQVMNSALAITTIKVIEEAVKICFDDTRLKQAVYETVWEGRLEEVETDIYVDGAHNTEGIKEFIKSVSLLKNSRRCVLLFSVVKDKHFEEMIENICESNLFEELVITQLEGTRKLEVQEIYRNFMKYTNQPITVFDDIKEALDYGKQSKDEGLLFCVGSLYLVGEIKKMI